MSRSRVAVVSLCLALMACEEERGRTASASAAAPAPAPAVGLADVPLTAWGVVLQAPPGTRVAGSPPAAVTGADDSVLAVLEAGPACDVDLSLLNTSRDDLEAMHAAAVSSASAQRGTRRAVIDELTPAGYRTHLVVTNPLGEFHAVQVGTVVGDRLVTCAAGQLSASEAACTLSICGSIEPRQAARP
jgi:hypothetical protein